MSRVLNVKMKISLLCLTRTTVKTVNYLIHFACNFAFFSNNRKEPRFSEDKRPKCIARRSPTWSSKLGSDLPENTQHSYHSCASLLTQLQSAKLPSVCLILWFDCRPEHNASSLKFVTLLSLSRQIKTTAYWNRPRPFPPQFQLAPVWRHQHRSGHWL